MKLHPEDPRITAYLLGELGTEEAAAVGQAIAADPALQAALDEMGSVGKTLSATLAHGPNELSAAQRTAVLQAARQADLSGKTIPFGIGGSIWKPWLVSLGAAAAVVLGIFAITHAPTSNGPRVSTPPPEASPQPARQETTAPATPAEVAGNEAPASPAPAPAPPLTRPSGFVTVADSPSLDLPILSGTPNLDGIAQSVRTERKLPHHDSVRLEEILNSFPIRLAGVTAIARAPKQSWHPDTRDEGVTAHTATLATETLPCPWKPSATLLLVSIRGNAKDDCEAKVAFHPSSTAVFRYRLLGFKPDGDAAGSTIPSKLAARSSTTLAIEIEPSTATGDLGTIEWTVNGQVATPVTITRSRDTEPSNDARFAALVCAYAQWLAGEQTAVIDPEVLSAFAREISASDLPADRTDFLKLVEESLQL